jgi:hypothetical protein
MRSGSAWSIPGALGGGFRTILGGVTQVLLFPLLGLGGISFYWITWVRLVKKVLTISVVGFSSQFKKQKNQENLKRKSSPPHFFLDPALLDGCPASR